MQEYPVRLEESVASMLKSRKHKFGRQQQGLSNSSPGANVSMYHNVPLSSFQEL
jgi:hypothetical protein